jgi:hypothetical protein
MLGRNPDKLTAAKVNIFTKINVFFMNFLQTIAEKVKEEGRGDKETGGQGERGRQGDGETRRTK